MSFLPIVERELRTRARQASTYWLRCGAALLASGVAGVMMMGALLFGPGAAGKIMFASMAWPAWLFCLIEGLRHTADCLSEEKREGTLGLLFLTDLKGHDVVLGKFMASSLSAFFTLLATVPALAIPLLWGGVTPGEFWRMVLALTNTLFFSLSAGIFVSAVSRQERHAWLGSGAVVGFFTAVLPGLAALAGGWKPLLASGSCWTVFSHVYDAEDAANPELFWTSLVTVHVLGWLGLVLGSVFLPRTWQEKTRSAGSRLGRFCAAHPRLSQAGAGKRAGGLDENPVLWLAACDDRRRWLVWVPVLAAASGAGLMWWGYKDVPGMRFTLWTGSVILHLMLTVWVGWEACHAFGDLRRSGVLELLLGSPLSVGQIVQGQDAALRRLFLRPVLCLLAVELMFLGFYFVHVLTGPTGSAEWLGSFLVAVMVGAGMVLFVLDLAAVARVGMWLSLSSRKPAQAWGRTMLWVELMPLLVALVPGLVTCGFGGIFMPGILAAKSILFCAWAQGKLMNDLRQAAAQHYDTRPEKWWRWK